MMLWHNISRMVAATVGLTLLSAAAGAQEFIDCPTAMPSGGPPATASYQMLNDVCFLDRFPPSSLPILLFDDFSWRSFVALVWPAKHGQRGVPNSGLTLGSAAGAPTVFVTLKSEWEL